MTAFPSLDPDPDRLARLARAAAAPPTPARDRDRDPRRRPLALFDARRRRPPRAKAKTPPATAASPPTPRPPRATRESSTQTHASSANRRKAFRPASLAALASPPPPPPPRRRERSTDGNAGGNADARPTGRPRRVFGSGATAKTSHGVRARVRERSAFATRSTPRAARRRTRRRRRRCGASGRGGTTRTPPPRRWRDGAPRGGGWGLPWGVWCGARGGGETPRGGREGGRTTRGIRRGGEGRGFPGEGEEEEHAYESNERETKRWCGTNQPPRFPRSGGRYIRQRGKTVEIARYVINRRLDALLFFSRFLGSSKMARQARK